MVNSKVLKILNSKVVLSFFVCLLCFIFYSLKISHAEYTCTIPPGDTGCCPFCNFTSYNCSQDPPNICGADPGTCKCSTYKCNSTPVCTDCCTIVGGPYDGDSGNKYDCYTCCCTLAGSPPPGGGHDPKGWLDSANCNNGIISTGRWTCDQDNYSKSLDVKIYMDGTSSSNLIASGTASLTREQGVCTACGGTCNHGFGISTSGTY